MKRLFLFAFYDPQGVVGEAALRYLEALRDLGDVVLATDCDLQPGEADKLAPLVLSYQAARHGEYDFGSYKRAYLQADLSGYDHPEWRALSSRVTQIRKRRQRLSGLHIRIFASPLKEQISEASVFKL